MRNRLTKFSMRLSVSLSPPKGVARIWFPFASNVTLMIAPEKRRRTRHPVCEYTWSIPHATAHCYSTRYSTAACTVQYTLEERHPVCEYTWSTPHATAHHCSTPLQHTLQHTTAAHATNTRCKYAHDGGNMM